MRSNEPKKSRLGIFCMILGGLLVLGAAALYGYNCWEDQSAAQATGEVLPILRQEVEKKQEDLSGEISIPDPYDPEMTVVTIEGQDYVGMLAVPALDLEMPILSQWSQEKLRYSPCRYSGSTKTNDLVIAAHNYSSHFGRLNKLQQGDSVIFTDMDGVTIFYQVASVEVLPANAVEEMTAGEYDLSLFTCTYDGQQRFTVRCVLRTQDE